MSDTPMTNEEIALDDEMERLLDPIPGECPTGKSLRYEGAYDRIADARREDDSTLSQGVWKSPMKRADWNEVERLCITELQTRTKDLQIACWLLEAWLHLHHFSGLRYGLEFLRELLNRFWDDLYPSIEDGDVDYRIAPITWVNEKLSVQVKLIPITFPEGDEPAYCWSDWENACRIEVPDPKLSTTVKSGHPPKLTLAEYQKSMMMTPSNFLAGTAAELERSMEACSAVESILDQRCGKSAPSLRQIWNVLESIHALMISQLSQRHPEEVEQIAISSPARTVIEPRTYEDRGPLLAQNPIKSRSEAYQRLAEAAEYLARIEPHSPTPYLVQRAILWGSMNLPELLPELVRNQNELGEIFRLLQLGEVKRPEK